jgi:succinoglycan biosynthesis transport protein ExoP
MSPLQFLSILKARWKIAFAILLLTVITTIAVSLSLPKGYTATSAVVVDIRPDPVAGMVLQGGMAAGYLATQMDIMVSDRVARRVVSNLKLAENPETRQQWMEATQGNGNIDSWLAGLLAKNLVVTPSRESAVVTVSYSASEPEFAAAIANAFVQAYIDTTLDLRVDPAKRYSSFFDERAKQLRDEVEAKQAKLSAYQRERGIIGDDRMDIESARLSELSTQLVMLQALSADSSSRTAQARVSGERMQEVLSNPAVNGLRSEVTRQEARLQEINSRLGDAHPQVIEQRAILTELRSRLQAEIGRVSGSVSVTNTINRGREAEIRAALEAQRAKLLKMKSERDDVAVLQRDVEGAQRAYDAILARLNQTSLESQNTNTNVSVLSPAVAPTSPSSPKIVLNAILAFAVGTMLAVAAALLIEWVDRRVRTTEDVVQVLDLPMIGVMPKPGGRGFLGRTKNPMIPRRVLARLPQAPARST